MNRERLPDCRPQRPELNVTCASSHPELATGEFAMPTRIPVRLNSAEQDCIAKWSWGYAVAIIVIVVATLSLPGLFNTGRTSLAETQEPTTAAQLALP
jgi:hypothetical protein